MREHQAEVWEKSYEFQPCEEHCTWENAEREGFIQKVTLSNIYHRKIFTFAFQNVEEIKMIDKNKLFNDRLYSILQ